MNLAHALRLHPGALIAFTGAGGKTTAMLRLGRELAGQGLRVLATTTTRLGLDQLELFPSFLVDPAPAEIDAALVRSPFLLAVRALDPAQHKALGFPPDRITEFRAQTDVVLVEADGSRGLPIKAPAPDEPVIPPGATHVVTLAHLAALGQPLGPAGAHRPELVARLTGLGEGDRITPAALARLLLHPAGPARGAPDGAERHLLLNGCEGLEIGDWLLEIDSNNQSPISNLHPLPPRLAAAPGIASVMLGQTAHDPPVLASFGKIAVIVLAAGGSSRFGSPKQLLDWGGQPLLRHVVLQALAAPCQQVIVVLGAAAERIAPELAGLPVELVANPVWEQGQSTSMQAGLRACRPETQAALFVLGDQPTLPPALLRQLIAAHRRSRPAIVAPRHQGRRGNPVLFDRRCFPDLLAVGGDAGGRAIFERYQGQIAWLEAGPEVLADVDRPEDVAGLPV
ncbi:MAG: putative selenium-dependent hydroxylase accessory protein YqeC [Caldilineales bacterium]|nr:putative selenium-dependent hydroxylase accessory protein YqeC [Caldilineales bacterium]MCW5856873.1 putative selenium-dependent hydroxylase accessory protein YqeC [Caldilineales bacterium]